VQSRHLDPMPMQLIGELSHRWFFAMNEKCHLASLNTAVPCEQFSLIGMNGKPINGVDSCANRYFFTKERYMLCSINHLPRQSAYAGKAHKNDRRLVPTTAR
jgi:hypothetical protein